MHMLVSSLHLINKVKPVAWFISACMHIFTLPWFLVATFYRSRNSGRACAELKYVLAAPVVDNTTDKILEDKV